MSGLYLFLCYNATKWFKIAITPYTIINYTEYTVILLTMKNCHWFALTLWYFLKVTFVNFYKNTLSNYSIYKTISNFELISLKSASPPSGWMVQWGLIPVAFALEHSLAQPIHGLDFLACLANHAGRTPLVMWWSTLCNISVCYSYNIMAVNVFNSWSGNLWLSTHCTVIIQHCVLAPVFTYIITSSPSPAPRANVHSNHDFTAPH